MKDPQAATERVGRYQLLEPIGAGPNGAVSRAKVFGVAGFERQFAIKRFLGELTASTPMAQALSAAARSYGSLEHPRIARMSEFGVAQGQTFTAVEHVSGLDAMRLLAEAKLAGSGLAAGGALGLISQAARAVGYAHGRGLSHLGLAPTNVIITPEGDVKVTDFGVLAALMPAEPVDSPRLANRIGYLAPEQLAGEATSAATDVFVLGVIAYELVNGTRAYGGATPQQIAQAILAGPPPEPSLPRPIVRVLQRCIARSPFERFPDARAFADALDAALRVAPVPGTRKDIGAEVKAALDRFAAMNEGNMSGVVALNIGTGPITVQRERRESAEIATTERSALPARNDQAAATLPELAKPFSTVPGLPPPPIPVPPGMTSGSPPLLGPSGAPATMLGMTAAKRPLPTAIPSIKKLDKPPTYPPPLLGPAGAPSASADPAREATTQVDLRRPGTENERAVSMSDVIFDQGDQLADEIEAGPLGAERRDSTVQGHAPLPLPPSQSFHVEPTGQMSPLLADKLNQASTRATGELPAVLAEVYSSESAPDELPEPPEVPEPTIPRSGSTMPGVTPAAAPTRRSAPLEKTQAVRATGSRAPKVVLGVLLLGGLGAAGWFAWTQLHPPDGGGTLIASKGSGKPHGSATTGSATTGSAMTGSATTGSAMTGSATTGSDTGGSAASGSDTGSAATGSAATGSDTGSATGSAATGSAATGSDTGSAATGSAATGSAATGSAATGSAATGSAATGSAATGSAAPVPADAAVAKVTPDAATVTPSGSSDTLKITSTPSGARVFLDGADQGATPLKLPGSADRHAIALLMPGHDLYIAEVEGHGVFSIPLKAVTPPGGPAGIKVIKCKDKERYYVYVDGKPTGMTCPTERIDCVVGAHTVEVYDLVTETRRKWDIQVKDTRLSVRVRVE